MNTTRASNGSLQLLLRRAPTVTGIGLVVVPALATAAAATGDSS
ncbi:MAG TPA: hypothetical protein VF516_37295 [Kofleriaceae bacterium]